MMLMFLVRHLFVPVSLVQRTVTSGCGQCWQQYIEVDPRNSRFRSPLSWLQACGTLT